MDVLPGLLALSRWLDEKGQAVKKNVRNPAGLFAAFEQEVQQGAAKDKSAWDASRSVMPEVRAQGVQEINARGQELGGLLGTFAGVGAKTADAVKLGKAKDMVKAGADPVQVWQQTGWTNQFPDGKWRFEISDKPAKVKPNPADYGQDRLIAESVTHPDYFAAYPQLRDMTGTFDRQVKDLQGVGSAGFLEDYPHISVTASAKETKPITMHELQHVVQGEEGFARGGSIEEMARTGLSPQEKVKEVLLRNKMARAEVPDRNAINDELHKLILPGARYRRLAGEAEARLTQKRMDLTPEERLARPPWLEFDVPREQQIVRGLLGEQTGPAMSVDDELARKAKQHFGVTYSPAETGYLLPDGTRLDLSGKNMAVGYQRQGDRFVPASGEKDYLRGTRNTDHRDLPKELAVRQGTDGMYDFIADSGAVRYTPGIGGSTVEGAPVKRKQIEKLVTDFRSSGDPLSFDLMQRNGQTKDYFYSQRPTVDALVDWLKKNKVNVSALGTFGLLGAGAYGSEQQ